MPQSIALPECLNIKYESDPEEIIDSLMGDAFEAAQPALGEQLNKIEGIEEQLLEAYPDEEVDADDWLSHQIGMLLYTYISHRTGITVPSDKGEKRTMPASMLSTVLGDISEILGEKETQTMLRIVADHSDRVIAAKFGQQLN